MKKTIYMILDVLKSMFSGMTYAFTKNALEERYLGQAGNLVDLERRQREIMTPNSSWHHRIR